MTRRVYHRWKAEEDALIEELIGEHTTAYVAKRLGLEVGQINNRIGALGLSRKKVGVYSWNELQQIIGIDSRQLMLSWTTDGLLPRRKLGGRGRYGVYEYKERDLVAFLRAHPHMVDRQKVDAAYQQYVDERWITLGEAFRRGAAHIVSLEHACLAGTIPEARKRGVLWVIPERILPRLVEGRRRWASDETNRHQRHLYDQAQRRQELHKKRCRTVWAKAS